MKGKTKLLSFLAAMTLTCGVAAATQINPNFDFGNLVFAEQSQEAGSLVVAGTSYESFEEALTAVSTMAGDVTVEVYGRVTWNKALTGSYDSIAFVGANDSAEIYLDVQGYLTATGKNVSFKDLKLSKVAGGYITNAGFMNLAFGVYDVASVTYTNCTFLNGAYASTHNVKFEGCTFYRSHDRYGLWAYGDTTVTVDGCTFADIRGIKMFAEGGAKTVDLTVTNTDFSAADNKPSIVLTYGKSVTLANNSYSPKGVFELDLDGDPNGTIINSTDELTCVNDNGPCGVLVAPSAKANDTAIYTTLAQAVAAAEAGDTVTVLASGDETVDVDKNLTITGTATLNNVGINANGADELTVSGLSFTGNSWINSGTAEKLTVSGVNANVTPNNGGYTNSRSAFISLGRSEQQLLDLTVENCQIVANGGADPILGWAAITGATIKGNTFGSADAYQSYSDSVKFMGIANGAVFNVTGNTVYSDYNGFVFGQNTTRANAYTVNVSGNTFMGGADHIWVEVSGSNTTHATINVSSDNTLNGQAFKAQDIKAHPNLKTWTSYAGVDVVFNANGEIIGGNVAFASNDIIADGYALQADGRIGIENAQARIGNVDYATFEDALAAVKAGDTLTLMSDVTISGTWNSKGKTNNAMTIDGNGHTIKVTGDINDRGNYHAVFRFESDATVKNLTIDVSEATATYSRIRAISAKTNLTVDNCTFIGTSKYTSTRGIIFGEGVTGGTTSDSEVVITNSTFTNWARGLTDNENGSDFKSVTVTGNTFDGSNVWLSAYENVTFSGNTVKDAELNVKSYSKPETYTVTAKGNTLTNATATINAVDTNIDTNIPSAVRIGNTYYATLTDAAKAATNGAVIKLYDNITENVVINQVTGTCYTIDGAGYTLTGSIQVKTDSNVADAESKMITIKNLKFVATQGQEWFIKSEETNHYPQLTIDGCTFDGSNNAYGVVAVRLKSANNTTIKNSTGTKLHSLLQNTSGWNLTIDGVTVTDSARGMALGTVQGATITNTKIAAAADKYGIRLDADTYNSTIVIEDCEVSAFIPVVVRKASASNYELTITGTNKMTAANSDGLWLAVGTSEYEENGKMPTAVTGMVNVTVEDATLSKAGMYGSSAALYGETFYETLTELLDAICVNNTITLTDDLTIYGKDLVLTLPAATTINGNGYTINGNLTAEGNLTINNKLTVNGTLKADADLTVNEALTVNGTLQTNGDVTFAKGATTVTAFTVGFYGKTITICEEASLNVVGSGRVSVGWGNTFNITGTLGTAKSATPSLYVKEGLSFVGTGVNFNVTKALVKFDKYCSSKNSSASGTFNFNVTNSIWEQGGSFVFSAPTNGNNPTFNFNLKDSVFNSTSHIVFAATNSNVVFDNSNVNVGNAQQFENRGTLTIQNGSVVHAANAESQNAGMAGTTIVDASTYIGTGNFSGAIVYDEQIGMLIAMNNATVTLNNIDQMVVYYEDNCAFSYNKAGSKASIYMLNTYTFTVTPSTNALKANESLTVDVSIDKAYYSVEYTFTYDAVNFTCAADSDHDGVIFVTGLYKGEAGVLATYTLTAKNEINSVDSFNFAVSGKVLQYKEQTINNIDNDVFGETESVKVSLNYTASVVADYVSGYSLVLVKGDDAGYAYNGNKMFYVEAYKAYAYLVEGAVTAEMIDAALSKTTDCEKIYQSYDVNAEYVADGIVDIKDATAVYACSIKDFVVEDYVELYLRADVNGDGKVNVVDINEIVKCGAYTK